MNVVDIAVFPFPSAGIESDRSSGGGSFYVTGIERAQYKNGSNVPEVRNAVFGVVLMEEVANGVGEVRKERRIVEWREGTGFGF